MCCLVPETLMFVRVVKFGTVQDAGSEKRPRSRRPTETRNRREWIYFSTLGILNAPPLVTDKLGKWFGIGPTS